MQMDVLRRRTGVFQSFPPLFKHFMRTISSCLPAYFADFAVSIAFFQAAGVFSRRIAMATIRQMPRSIG